MVNVNKFFVILFMAASILVIKAENVKEKNLAGKIEDTKIEQVSELEQWLNKGKEVVANIRLADIKEKIAVADTYAQRFFTAYSTVNVAAGMFLGGKAAANYQKANNASKYFDITRNLNIATMDKDKAHQMKEAIQQSKDFFVRSCKKAGKGNAVVGLALLMGHGYYNRIQKETVVNNQKNNPTLLIETMRKDDSQV